MSSKRRHEGYLLVDQRESPGVPFNPAMIGKPDALLASSGQMLESATVTCSHCQVVVVLNPMRTRPRGYCQKCDRYVCDNPACNLDCVPYAALLDRQQEQAMKDLALGRIVS
jgi:hypothetical protein